MSFLKPSIASPKYIEPEFKRWAVQEVKNLTKLQPISSTARSKTFKKETIE